MDKAATIIGRSDRLNKANDLIKTIASCGRRFFAYQDRLAYLTFDARSRVWFVDEHTQKLICTHYKGRWKHFTHGGTLKKLVTSLKDFIIHEKPLRDSQLGPWPEWLCDGDLWGYEDDMDLVRAKAVELGILKG